MWDSIVQLILTITTTVSTIMILFGVIVTVYGFKYRRDNNLNLRKDIHFQIADNYYALIENIDNFEKLEENKSELHLITLIYSPITKKKFKFNNNLLIKKSTLINEMKNWRDITDDFKLSENFTFKELISKKPEYKSLGESREKIINSLFLISIALFTDSIEVIKYDKIYKKLVKETTGISRASSRSIKKITKNLKIKEKNSKN